MVLLNILLVAQEDSRTLIGWEIMKSLSPDSAFATLLHEKLLAHTNLLSYPWDQVQLELCFVGKEKHLLEKQVLIFPSLKL